MNVQALMFPVVHAPGSFASLMVVYENNYKNIKELCPLFDAIDEEVVSRVPGHLPLRLRLLEQFPYTTTVSLTYLFREAGAVTSDPDLVVRLYHDARQAEVLGFGENAGRLAVRPGTQTVDRWVLERRWHLNRFLERWLEYCLDCGHRF